MTVGVSEILHDMASTRCRCRICVSAWPMACSPDNVHAIIVARDGVLVYEQYAAGQDQYGLEPAKHTVFDAATRHNGNSMTKSVTSLLVGIALQRGWITTLDTPVLDFFPEYADLRTPEKSAITLVSSADDVGRP